MTRIYLIIILFYCLTACQLDAPTTKQYLFLGHPYSWHDPYKIDPRLESFDFLEYDQIWLGGDVCAKTTEKKSTLEYLDSLFDLDSERIHWTIGNHDLKGGHQEWISEFTKRPAFYTIWQDGICLMILNTNLFWFFDSAPSQENCETKQAQLIMIEQVLDTLKEASHLVVLHHHAILTELKKNDEGDLIKTFNINPLNIRPSCDSTLELTSWLYPKLTKVQQKGIPVFLIGGDFGMRAKAFAHQTEEGIWMLGSGINNSIPRSQVPDYVTSLDPDKVLILEHQPKKKLLDWKFVQLDSLIQTNTINQN